jgi:hypothetical protein
MYVTDNLGSVVAVIDSSGHGTLNNPYTPYGLDAQPGSLDPMLTFTGALQDTVGGTTPGTGFVHLGDRWYRPPVEPNAGVGNETGPAHFTQPDSMQQLVNPTDGNLYAYAADNPVNYIDPAGQSFWSDLLSVGQDLLGLASACYAGIGGAEAAAAPAQPLIALLPGADFIGEVGIPAGGCLANMVASTYIGLNLF